MKRKKNSRYENLPMIDKLPLWCELEQAIIKHKINIGIDKLKLCYTVVNDSIIKELEENKPEWYNLDYFDLHRIEGKYHNDIYQIWIKDLDKNNEIETVKFGELRFNLKAEKEEEQNKTDKPNEKRVWIYIDNKTLYSENRLSYLDYIRESLGLSLRNITEIEIYIDSTKKNIPQLLKRMVRYKDYKAFLNGKEVVDREEYRPELDYNHSGNMNRYTNMTFYASSIKALKTKLEGIRICGYDKITEIKYKSKKDYILDFYKNPAKLFRVEIRVGNEKFKEYLNENRIELLEFLFEDKGFLYLTFEWFFEKVIYFKDANNEKISVADIML
jgi:hypothetical protein